MISRAKSGFGFSCLYVIVIVTLMIVNVSVCRPLAAPNPDFPTQNYAQESVTITTEFNKEGGSITPAGPKTVPKGTLVSFVIDANSGYYIEELSVYGKTLNLNVPFPNHAETSFTAIKTGSVKAKFARCYDLWAQATDGGTIEPGGFERVKEGESRSYTITPQPGYEIVDVTDNERSLGPVTEYALDNIRSNHKVFAYFAEENFTITVRKNAGGNVGPTGDGRTIGPEEGGFEVVVPRGGGWILKIASADCHKIKDVKVDGESKGPATGLTFSGVVKDHTVVVEFEKLGPFTVNPKFRAKKQQSHKVSEVHQTQF